MPRSHLSDPPTRIAAAALSDTVPQAFRVSAISFSAVGTIKVTTTDGDVVSIPSGALAAGIQHSMDVSLIWSTGTTATNIMIYGG